MYKKIYISNDHAAVDCKNKIVEHLSKKYEVVNLGTDTNDSVNYVEYARKTANVVAQDKDSLGIVICGTGIGISIAANKTKGIRCALIYNKDVAKLAKQHNNANIIAFGSRQFEPDQIIEMIEEFLNSSFEGGRHQERINSIE